MGSGRQAQNAEARCQLDGQPGQIVRYAPLLSGTGNVVARSPADARQRFTNRAATRWASMTDFLRSSRRAWPLVVALVLGCNVQVPGAERFDDATGVAPAEDADAAAPDIDPGNDVATADTSGQDVSGQCAAGCDDQNPCTEDTCSKAGACVHAAVDGGSCDDGNACTAGETCSDGKCLGGKAKVCDDNNTCTADACLPAKGCTHTDDDGAACTDNDACTQKDTCLAGKCTGNAMTCGADDCNTAKCLNGGCTAAPKIAGLKCDDGDACTSGTKCNGGGLCAGGSITDCEDNNPCTEDSCDSQAGCQHDLASGACSDGDGCTVGDACSGGTCKPGPAKACDDGNGCTANVCNPVDGACTVTATTANCSDGNACTADDVCEKGACVPGKAVGCDDGNACTVDSCDASNGLCSHVAGSSACDDGNGCTIGDACVEGTCVGGAAQQCADKDTCTNDSCDAKTGGCVHSAINGCGDTCLTAQDCKAGDLCNTVACLSGKCAFLPTSAPCDDGDTCTLADTCQGGSCKPGSAKNCDDGNPCTNDACGGGVCLSVANTATCNDNNACTLGDACANGLCAPGAPKVCEDDSVCTSDGCDPQSGSCTATANTAGCDDKNPCTQGDACQGGTCLAGSAVSCDDGNLCTNDACDLKTGKCAFSNSTAPCSDGDACSQGDACLAGACVSGTAKVCDDSNPCTNDGCDSATAACKNLPNAATCTDGDACSIGDGCSAGACKVGAAKVCSDSDTCTNDTCDSSSGNCVFKAITGCGGNCQAALDCKDGNPCTDDACVNGKCAFPANTATCDDANGCTLGDVCAGGGCKSGSAKGCDDGNPCTADACAPKTGACSNVANTASCDDGNACTAGDVCGGAKCQPGKPTACNDGNVCTDDACDPTTGACKAVANTAVCDDSNACTIGDICTGSACKSGTGKNCDDSNGCTNDGCNAATGACTHVANSMLCNDNNACTQGDVCAASACKPGSAKSCDDGNVCTDDSCDKTTGSCVNGANGAACNDGNKCTLSDKCGLGSCQPGTAVACDDKEACTNDSCNPGDGACVYAPKIGCGGNCAKSTDCTDFNACTDDQCVNGKCAFPVNTATCDDTNPCTIGDVCAAGTCKAGSPKACDDSNLCTNDSCNVANGTCAHVNNTAACSDSNACTIGDACSASKCIAGQPKSCNDSNGCTSDSCNSGTGSCVNVNNIAACNDNSACTTGDACQGGVCKGGAAPNCDDGKPCTTDSCDPASGCKYVSNTLVCTDGNACTTNDTCGGGTCLGGAALACDDGKACTTDSCDPGSGCKFANNTLGCSDGNACTLNDGCASGSCQAGAAKVCNDNDDCTTDSCDPAGGTCVYKPIFGCGGNCAAVTDCGDGNLCTTDACSSGKCAYANNTFACNDANACTTNDACAGGACLGGLAPNCDDSNPCTSDSCDKTKGCQNVNNTSSCNDNNLCTTGDLCNGGVCVGGAAPNCDDNNGCTTDGCDKLSGCSHAHNTATCNDGSACTSGDVCSQGSCAGAVIDCDDKKACTADTCDNSLGCQNVNLPSGAACDDGNACSVGDNCQSGVCNAGNLVWVDKLGGNVPNPNGGAGSGGYADGALGKSLFNTPTGLAFDPKSGHLFIADTNNNMIRKMTLAGDVSTFAGNPKAGSTNGVGTAASFNHPMGVAVDGAGNVYVADMGNSLLRKIAGDGTVTTLAGSAGSGFADGTAATAKFTFPRAVAVSATGVVAIADTSNHAIRIYNPSDATVTTLAGVGVSGYVDGEGAKAKFNTPTGVGFDSTGAVWVADQNNHRIRKVAPSGIVQTAGGDGVAGYLDNLDPTKSRFNYPTGLLVTPAAVGVAVYIADSFNGRVRRGSATGVTTVAGGGALGPADGPAANVSFYLPSGIAADGSGYLYVADTYNHIIRRIRDSNGACNINGACYVAGINKPGDTCQTCAAANPTNWSPKGSTGTCDDSNPCTPNDLCMTITGAPTCSGNGVACNDGNACTDDACDNLTAKCTFTPNTSACNDNDFCTKGDFCDQGTCYAGGGNFCDDANPCTLDTCAAGGSCTFSNVAFGTACQGAAAQAYGFCSGKTCTGLEQSALIMPGNATSSARMTGASRGPDGKLQVSGFGTSSISAQSSLYVLDPTVSPPTVSQVLGGNPVEYWALAYRLVTGGKSTLPTVSDSQAATANYTAVNGWQNVGVPTLPAAQRILRQVSYVADPNGSELYYAGGNADFVTNGTPKTTLNRFKYSPGTNAWSVGGVSGVGEMGLFNSYITSSTACISALMTAHIAGLYAADSASLWIAANSTTSPSTPYIALWGSSNGMNATCAGVAPGGAIMATTSGNGWALAGTAGQVVTAVHGSSTYHALAVGYTASNQPIIWNLSSTALATESPQPTPPTGMPAFASGAYIPTAVTVSASRAWVVGTILSGGCNYLWALHGTVNGSGYIWDKLLVSTSTAYVCNSNVFNQLTVTRVWADPSDTGVYITGSAAKDALGGTKVSSTGSSQGQFGVVWRIK